MSTAALTGLPLTWVVGPVLSVTICDCRARSSMVKWAYTQMDSESMTLPPEDMLRVIH